MGAARAPHGGRGGVGLRAGRALGLLALLVVPCSCAPERPLIVERAAAPGDDQAFPRDELFPVVPVRRWVVPFAPGPTRDDPNPPLFSVALDGEAARAQLAEVVVEGIDVGTVSIWWESSPPAAGEPGQMQRQIEQSGDRTGATLRFALADDPRWRGSAGRLWVMTDRRVRPRLRVREVSLLSRRRAADAGDAWLKRSWRFSIGNDQRRAFPALPGTPLRRPVLLPGAARLRFDYALEGGVRAEVRFRVLLDRGATGVETVFDESIDGRLGATPSWREANVELPTRGEEPSELRFEVDAGPEFEAGAGVALWGDPLLTTSSRSAAPPNLVLISADTLRADRLAAYGHSRPTSPHLDAWLARRGVLFSRTVAAAPSTLPAHASLFTGLDPPRHGGNGAPAASDLETLAEILRGHGYRTLAVTGGGFLHPHYGLDQGFDLYRHWLWGYERERELPESIDWIEERLADLPEPFFLFVHTYETHSPYRARAPYFERWSAAPAPAGLLYPVPREGTVDEGFLYRLPARYELRGRDPSAGATGTGDERLASDLYDSSVAFLDAQAGRLLSRLETSGLADRTLVVFTSDHGESLGEHGLAGHGTLFEENLHVPLIVATPGRAGAGTKIEAQARTVDLLPTILDLLALPVPRGLDGRSLAPLVRGDGEVAPLPALSYAGNSNRGLALSFERGLKLLAQDTAWAPLAGRRELFDLRSDPGESEPRVLEAERRELLEAWLVARIVPGWRGAVVHWRADPARPLLGRLSSPGLSNSAVKSLGRGRARAELLGDGAVALELAAGEEGYLLLAPEATRALALHLEAGNGASLEWAAGAGARNGVWELRDGAWRTAARFPETGAALELVVRAEDAAAPPVPARDRELLEQMRALGYIP